MQDGSSCRRGDENIAQASGHPNALRGIMLVMVAVFLCALADSVTKRLTPAFPVPLVVAERYLVSLFLVVAVYAPGSGCGMWRTRRTGLVLLRSLCLSAASLTMGLALRTLPVGETVSIVYLSPFAVLPLAGPLLGEKVGLVAWIGASVSFALANVLFGTGYHLLTRTLSRGETTAALMFHPMLTGFLVLLPFALGNLAGAAPAATDYLWMAVLGVLATGGPILFTDAYRHSSASTRALINYLHLVWAAILGWLIFGHIPDAIALAGMAAILLAGLCVTLLSRSSAPVPQVE